MEKTTVVITGSTRGLGFRMAQEFLSHSCAVLISGRTEDAVQAALALLKKDVPEANVYGFPCDTRDASQVQALWDQAEKRLGKVDHWINNAGIGQPIRSIWDVSPDVVEDVFRTNVLGVLSGARVAMRGMMQRNSGSIWFMEGHGSDGSIRRGLSVYGASKRALRYVARALAVEAKGTGILVGALSPGIMVTDFTMRQLDRTNREEWERTKRVFNILADKPETVAVFLVPRILAARKSGMFIAWLKNTKIMWRFMTAGITKRRVIEE
ncbi:MAG: SDR family oxidoreductase [Spirochaetia bacterium]|jgi:NAD(P)-dependent dehydrogenase (short-subunit alcohol dehydrogenase family)